MYLFDKLKLNTDVDNNLRVNYFMMEQVIA